MSAGLSLLKKKWVYLNRPARPVPVIPELAPTMLQILTNRGMDTEEKVLDFLRPTMDKLSELNNILNIKPAAEFLLGAIEAQQKITVYGL